ncbi:unnamed protein product, partial [Vitis vinifera]
MYDKYMYTFKFTPMFLSPHTRTTNFLENKVFFIFLNLRDQKCGYLYALQLNMYIRQADEQRTQASSAMDDPEKLHIVMFPWLAFGHILPYLELSKLIAQEGHRISFISTPRNIERLPKLPPNLQPLIDLVKFPLPNDDNLPENAEATTDLPYGNIPYLKKAFDGLQEPVTRFLETSHPDWVIHDFAPHWLPPIAAKHGVSRAFFCIFSATALCFGGSTRSLDHDQANVSGVSDSFRMGSAILGCDVLAIRSCTELEPEWLDLLGKLHQKPLFPIGLLPPSAPVTPTEDELTELAFGLELSGLPFFWALRKRHDAVDLPDRFEERTKGRGMVWRSWAPQLRILDHDSVGGFVTHCGWSSVIEGLHFGQALIMLPLWGDQGVNARTFEEMKVGVEIPRDQEEERLSRKSVAETLSLVMVEETGKIYRNKAKEMSKLLGDKHRHHRYVSDFVEYLQKHRLTHCDHVIRGADEQRTQASSAMDYPEKLHIVMFPWLAFGHILPYLELSKLIAQKGHRISFISTPRNIDRLPKLPPILQPLINLIKLPLPKVDNLPENAEATTDLPYEEIPYLKKAFDGLQEPLTHFLINSHPDWVVHDFAPHWLPPVLDEHGVSRSFFSIYGASTLCFAGSTSIMLGSGDPRKELHQFAVPPPWVPFPSNLGLPPFQMKRILGYDQPNLSGVSDSYRMGWVISALLPIGLLPPLAPLPTPQTPNPLQLSPIPLFPSSLHCKAPSRCRKPTSQRQSAPPKNPTMCTIRGADEQRNQASSAMDYPEKLHIVMFPWLAFGHILPYLELSKLIAREGHLISFISTPRNIDRLPKLPLNLQPLIDLVKFPLPNIDNLPENAEATTDLPYEKIPYLKKAFDGLQEPVTRFLETSHPDWVIHDFTPHWLPPIAAKHGVSRAFFCTSSATTLCFCGPTSIMMEADVSGVSDKFRMGSAILGCDVLAIRSCTELEPEWLDLLGKLHQKPLFPIGLLPPSAPVTPTEDELTELAFGLELSGLPFFWALRKRHDSVDLPDGFEERTKGRGMVWRTWAPQLRILDHESVGGFVIHCGWSSVIEGLHFGQALTMLPLWGDQGLNARTFEEMKVGVEIPRDQEEGWLSRKSVAETLSLVMVEEAGKIYRNKAKEMRKLLDKHRHHRYVTDFAEYLQKHRPCSQRLSSISSRFLLRGFRLISNGFGHFSLELYHKPVLPIGLLPPLAPVSGEDDSWIPILEWLDKQEKASVRHDSVELPDGFEDRTKDRGVVWRTWAPQLRILGHESVGGFVTHCGLSSVVEGLNFGRALIMFPLWGDQGIIAKSFQEMKVGIEIPRDEEEGWFSSKSVAQTLSLVMVEEEGRIYREKAKELSKLFGDKDLQQRYINDFVEYLQNHRRNRKD